MYSQEKELRFRAAQPAHPTHTAQNADQLQHSQKLPWERRERAPAPDASEPETATSSRTAAMSNDSLTVRYHVIFGAPTQQRTIKLIFYHSNTGGRTFKNNNINLFVRTKAI
jgi:hypothetical protein